MEQSKARFINKYHGRGYDRDFIFLEYEYRGQKYEVYINTAKGNEPLSWQHKNAQARIDKMIELEHKTASAPKEPFDIDTEMDEIFKMLGW